jgi:hypothetical protein
VPADGALAPLLTDGNGDRFLDLETTSVLSDLTRIQQGRLEQKVVAGPTRLLVHDTSTGNRVEAYTNSWTGSPCLSPMELAM